MQITYNKAKLKLNFQEKNTILKADLELIVAFTCAYYIKLRPQFKF